MSLAAVAVPDELRWQLLRAALAGDEERYARLSAEIEDVERAAAAGRAAHAAAVSRAGRLF